MPDRWERKTKRCNLFDDDGQPRKLKDGTRGCPRDASSCFFVHPYEPEWHTAAPSLPPRRDLVADGDSSYYYQLLGHSQSSKAMGSGSSQRHLRSPVASSSSDPLERQRHDVEAKESQASTDRQPVGLHLTGSNRNLPSSFNRKSENPPSSPALLTSRPPAPQGPPPPLPPLPTAPAFSLPKDSHPGSHSLKGLSLDEQRKVWHERIDLMFGSITARHDFTKIERDLESIRLLSQSSCIIGLPTEERARIDNQRTALESQLEMKRKEIGDIIQRLMATEFWPVLRMPDLQNLEKTFAEVKKHVFELRHSMEELHSKCKELVGIHDSSATDEPPPGDERPKKRRRTGEGQDLPQDSTSPSFSAVELGAFHDKLDELRRCVSDLENDVYQRYEITRDEVELRIDERLQEDGVLSSLEKQILQVDIEAAVDIRNSALIQNIQRTEAEVGELAQEVASLITQHHNLAQRCSNFEVQNERLKDVIAELTGPSDSADVTATRKEVQTLNTALQAYISNTPSASAARLSPEYILKSLDDDILRIVREKFTPLLRQVRQDLMDKLTDSHSQACEAVSPGVKLLTQMMNVVAARVCQPETGQQVSSEAPP